MFQNKLNGMHQMENSGDHPDTRIHATFLFHDLARLEYGRLLWRNPSARERLLDHWNDKRHPGRRRFKIHRKQVERILEAPPEQDDELNQILMNEGTSLRALVREIPPVFGSFYGTKSEWMARRNKQPDNSVI